jgi:hypothetical protein
MEDGHMVILPSFVPRYGDPATRYLFSKPGLSINKEGWQIHGGSIIEHHPYFITSLSTAMATHHEMPKEDAITHVEYSDPAQNIEKADAAAKFLANAHVEDAAFTYEEERAVLKRIDFRVLPLLLGAYFFQQVSTLYTTENTY